jgi:hypothetical protein
MGKSTTSEQVKNTTSVRVSTIINPRQALVQPIEQNITDLRTQKSEKETALLNIRPKLEQKLVREWGF